ncbi:MAG: nucleotidyltransferase domain-containing protein [Deltaproteobacteria bacterium]|nr:nucleotidyltransferase domain-containing protein [Deltaproteobacteria bacterium]
MPERTTTASTTRAAGPTTTGIRKPATNSRPKTNGQQPITQPTASGQQPTASTQLTLPPWLTSAERSRLRRFARGVRRIAGPDLEKICLYGSRARGEGHAESDLDVLVVVRNARRYERRISDLKGDLMDAEGWPLQGQLSAVVLSKSQWQFLLDRELLFGREVSAEGLPL